MAESFIAGVRTLRRALLAVLALAVAGCAAGGAVFQALTDVPADQGVVYIYRPTLYASGSAVRIAVDGAFAGEVEAVGYLPLTLSPGPHVINSYASLGLAAPSSAPLEVKVISGGSSQYVRVDVTPPGFVPGVAGLFSSVALQRVDERAALAEIASLRLSE